jgi:hypothetical protein
MNAKLQNLIARITHGVIGLDLSLREKNKYLGDFLSLEEKEIRDALEGYNNNTIVEPILSSIKSVQEKIKKGIDRSMTLILINELEIILRLLYSLSGVVQ